MSLSVKYLTPSILGRTLASRTNRPTLETIFRRKGLQIECKWRILWDLWTQLQTLQLNLSTKRNTIWHLTNFRFVMLGSIPIIKSIRFRRPWNSQNTQIKTTEITFWMLLMMVATRKCHSLAWKLLLWTKLHHSRITRFNIAPARKRES